MTSHILFFLVDRYEPVHWQLRRVAVSRGHWFDSREALKLRPLTILRGTEFVSVLTRALLYCSALYNFSFFDFVSDNLALKGF